MRFLLFILLFSTNVFAHRSFFQLSNPAVITPIPPPSYDSDAQNYIDRVQAHGVVLTSTQQDSINSFFVNAKAESLYTPLYDGGILTFANAAANAESFKGLHDITWSGGITHGATGVTGNGTTGYGSLGFATNTLTLNNSHVAIYNRTNVALTNVVDIGARSGNTTKIGIFIKTSTNFITDHNSTTAGAGRVTVANSDASGFYISSRTSSTDLRAYRNGTQIGTTATTTNNGIFTPQTLTIMADNNSGTISLFSTREYCAWTTGQGLTPAQAATWTILVNNLLKAFGANTF